MLRTITASVLFQLCKIKTEKEFTKGKQNSSDYQLPLLWKITSYLKVSLLTLSHSSTRALVKVSKHKTDPG